MGLIFIPALTLKLNEKINTRVSLREKTKKIETPIKSEPFFYKRAKVSGIILVSGSLFVLYTLATFNFYYAPLDYVINITVTYCSILAVIVINSAEDGLNFCWF